MGRLGIELRPDGVSFEGYVCLDCGAGLGKTTPRASKHVCAKEEGILVGVTGAYKVGDKIGAGMVHWLEVTEDLSEGHYRYRDFGLVDADTSLGKCKHAETAECHCCDDLAHRIMSTGNKEETEMVREAYLRKKNGRRNTGGDEPTEGTEAKEKPETSEEADNEESSKAGRGHQQRKEPKPSGD